MGTARITIMSGKWTARVQNEYLAWNGFSPNTPGLADTSPGHYEDKTPASGTYGGGRTREHHGIAHTDSSAQGYTKRR